MAKKQHLEIIFQGARAWNQWRAKNPSITPNLQNADLNGANLSEVNFSNTNLMGAILDGSDLYKAKLNRARLVHASLEAANLNRAKLIDANLRGAKMLRIQLLAATLRRANLSEVNLNGGKLSGAILTDATLEDAELENTDFSGADLTRTDLSGAVLTGANLKGSNLFGAIIVGSNLSRANLATANLVSAILLSVTFEQTIFRGASIGHTTFGDVDLRAIKALETAEHFGRSTIGLDTIFKSEGSIPETFLRGVGLPDTFLTYMPSLTQNAFEFYSCFISYSSKDQEFAERLYADLQNKGVRCWFAPEDLKIGDRFRDRIDESIRLHDKLLLILSENSVSSPWVSDEVEAAIEREHREGRTVLFPIKIDEAMMGSEQAWAAAIRRTRHIGDFTRWKDHDSYQKAFERLLRDLKAEKKKS